MTKTFPIGPYTRRIIRWLDQATPEQGAEGRRWYLEARAFAADLAEGSNYTLEQVSAVIAVLSPQVNWTLNMQAAKDAVRAHSIGRRTLPTYTGYTANRVKAFRILDGDIEALRGPKVTAFHRAIMGDLSCVVLDIWAMRAARSSQATLARLFRQDEMPGAKERRAVQEAYRRAAASRGLAPAEAQAIVWVTCKQSGIFDLARTMSPKWYARQNRARMREGLTVLTGDYAWHGAPIGQAAAVAHVDKYAAEGIY